MSARGGRGGFRNRGVSIARESVQSYGRRGRGRYRGLIDSIALETGPTDSTPPSATTAVTSTSEASPQNISMATPTAKENLYTAASRCLNDHRFSDFTIVCDGKQFNVHRCFIAAHSKWFDRACSGPFKEASSQRVELHEDMLAAVECMINFFYTCDYDDSIQNATSTSEPMDKEPNNALQLNAWVYATADKYEVPTLKALALEKFTLAAVRSSKNRLVMTQTTYTVYKHLPLPHTDRALKRILVGMWIWHGKSLLPDDHASLSTLASHVPDFMADLTTRLLKEAKTTIRYTCKSCNWSTDLDPSSMQSEPFRCSQSGFGCTESSTKYTVGSIVTIIET